MTTFETLVLIYTDKDFIPMRRSGYSVTTLVERYPEGVPDHIVAKALMMNEDDIEPEYQRIVAKLRVLMGVED